MPQYNRFRDIDEINLVVAQRCNEEILEKAKTVMTSQVSLYENVIALIRTAFTYIYEKRVHFQYYTTLYTITNEKVQNEIVHYPPHLHDNQYLSQGLQCVCLFHLLSAFPLRMPFFHPIFS